MKENHKPKHSLVLSTGGSLRKLMPEWTYQEKFQNMDYVIYTVTWTMKFLEDLITYWKHGLYTYYEGIEVGRYKEFVNFASWSLS